MRRKTATDRHARFLPGPAPSAGVRLRGGEVHIWTVGLGRPEPACRGLLQLLSADERSRAEAFRFQEHRKRFIVRRGMLRLLLAGYLGCPPGALCFDHGANGKPGLARPFRRQSITFNLSHAGDIALYAFSRGRELGVDIERIRDIPEMEGIIERFFSAGEKLFINRVPPQMKRQAFFECWTRKEAFIKATGAGLSLPLASFDAAPGPDGERRQGPLDAEQTLLASWSIRTLRPAADHAGAVAVQGRRADLRCFTLTPPTGGCGRQGIRGETDLCAALRGS